MIERFGVNHKQYGIHLEEYRKYHDKLSQRLKAIMASDADTRTIEYLKSINKIWDDWMKSGSEKERVKAQVTYNNLVKPALELNRQFKDLPLPSESNDVLLACTYEYLDMENLLRVYQKKFKSYYLHYRNAQRILKTCLRIIK